MSSEILHEAACDERARRVEDALRGKRAAVVLARRPDGRVLAVTRRYRPGEGWALPGGKVDPGEAPAEAAARELLEETGVFADPRGLRHVYDARDADGYDVATFAADVDPADALSPEPGLVADWVEPARLTSESGAFPAYNTEVMVAAPRRVFVLGPSGSGKTTGALALARELGCRCVSAGAWVREAAGDLSPADLSRIACVRLRADPEAAVRRVLGDVRASYLETGELAEHVVVEGVRNPRDFALLYRPGHDAVVRVGGESRSGFESTGLDAVDFYLVFCATLGHQQRVRRCRERTLADDAAHAAEWIRKQSDADLA